MPMQPRSLPRARALAPRLFTVTKTPAGAARLPVTGCAAYQSASCPSWVRCVAMAARANASAAICSAASRVVRCGGGGSSRHAPQLPVKSTPA